ncbi:MAG TPA: radical SAM protein [Anaerolineales bacterium]|nr:radical SAM protein [Anaerolineales bacterium]
MAQSIYPTYFTAPVLDQYLVYAPLQGFSVILNENRLRQLESLRFGTHEEIEPVISEIAQRLDCPAVAPERPEGKIKAPLFLGLITTRGCNMSCRYCDFNAPEDSHNDMELGLARASIDAYLHLLAEHGVSQGEVQFFGGEPFFRSSVVEFALSHAHNRAGQMGIAIKFNVTTNGLMTERRAAWVADNFDTVVLSLDGITFQDHQRPSRNGGASYPIVHRTAKILSEGRTDLTIRACITDESTAQMPALAYEFARTYILSAVCFEPLTESRLSRANGLLPPDPVQFAREFCQAEDVLKPYGIDAISSGTDIDSLQASFCPVGKDALLVSPSGSICACYLMESDWMRAGLDLKFGRISRSSPEFFLELEKLEAIRRLARHTAPLCERCLCRYHCAGGCYVNHRSIQRASQYDSVCIRTRLITIGKLLKRMEALELYHRWLDSL